MQGQGLGGNSHDADRMAVQKVETTGWPFKRVTGPFVREDLIWEARVKQLDDVRGVAVSGLIAAFVESGRVPTATDHA